MFSQPRFHAAIQFLPEITLLLFVHLLLYKEVLNIFMFMVIFHMSQST